MQNPEQSKEMSVSVVERLAKLEDQLSGMQTMVQKLYERSEEVHRHIMLQRVWGFLKFLIIVVPLILAAVYLPPLIQNAFAPYQELLQGSSSNGSGASIDIESLLEQLQKGR